ncbi:hypothetical protein [Tateyamaria sp. SN6-1]|uniref:hypothetical protein n=1 Tax=Tateyamaria sp. SN6-1 TaxID=3092148 RepID=UPI0039F476A2
MCLASPAAVEFNIAFNWGDIPAFHLSLVSEGTTRIDFKLVDLDVPSFSHGGGKVKVIQNGTLPFGAFKWKSACPSGEVHTYQWQTRTKAGRKVLATARANRKYPE